VMRPPSIACPESFRVFAGVVERLHEPGTLTDAQLDRLGRVHVVAVGPRQRGSYLPGEQVVAVHEHADLTTWFHELGGHVALGHGGDHAGEAAARAFAGRLTGTAPGEVPVTPSSAYAFRREGGRLHITHDCGRAVEAWFPARPGHEAAVLVVCQRCEATGLVAVTGACCGGTFALHWSADASPSRPSVTGTCSKCGAVETLTVARREPHEPREPGAVYRDRTRLALTQAARQLRAVARGEIDPAMLGEALIGHVRLAARHLDEDARQHIESACRDARLLIDRDAALRGLVGPTDVDDRIEGVRGGGGELLEAALVLETTAKALD